MHDDRTKRITYLLYVVELEYLGDRILDFHNCESIDGPQALRLGYGPRKVRNAV